MEKRCNHGARVMESSPQPINKPVAVLNRIRDKTHFLRRHPEYIHTLGTLLSVVTSCPASKLAPPNIPFDAAHEHLYGENSCSWCRRNYERARSLKARAYDRSQGIRSEHEC